MKYMPDCFSDIVDEIHPNPFCFYGWFCGEAVCVTISSIKGIVLDFFQIVYSAMRK
jgi:hypothetical protein